MFPATVGQPSKSAAGSPGQSAEGAFADLPYEVCKALYGAASAQEIPPRTVLFHQGDAPSRIYQVKRGFVRLTHLRTEGAQVTLRMMTAGDLVGCVAGLRGFGYPATATAVDEVSVLCWPSAKLRQLLERHRSLSEAVYDVIGTRTREMVERVVEMSSRTAEQRLAAALMRLARQTGRSGPEGLEVAFPITRTDLAEMSGIAYFTISRSLREWQRQGLVQSRRHRIVILAPDRLDNLASGATTRSA